MTAPTFVLQTSGTTQQLNDVFGFGPSIVVAVGENGTILTWNGQQWLQRPSGIIGSLKQVWGATAPAGSPQTFWIAGNGGLLYSGDGAGAIWTQNQPLATAVAAAGATAVPNLGGVWGSSALDIWTIDNNTGLFWHTQNGGASWAIGATSAPVATTKPPWRRLRGASSSFIVVGSDPRGTNARFGLYDGSAWNLFTVGSFTIGTVLDAMPFAGASGQFFQVGITPSSPTGAQIVDWPPDLATLPPNDAVPSGVVQQLAAVYGSSLSSLYAVGVGFSGQARALQPTGPVRLPGATSSWASIPLPALPGQLNGVYSAPNGYAVMVGAGGGIAATPGTALSILAAMAIATNTVQVQLSNIPRAQSPIAAGDALNPNSWGVLINDPKGIVTLTTLAVTQVSPTVFNVIVAERLGSSMTQHLIGGTLQDPFGGGGFSEALFYGVIADALATQAAVAAANNYAVKDLANPPFPPQGQNTPGAVRVINAAGDFASVSGNALVRKLIIRRLSTSTNGFFHLPGYGLGLDPKAPIRSSNLIALKKQIEQQVMMEPEVQSVMVGLSLDEATGTLTISGTAITTQGQTVPFQTQVQGGGVS